LWSGIVQRISRHESKADVGIEFSPEACEDFTFNLDEFEQVSLYEALAEDVLNSNNFNPK